MPRSSPLPASVRIVEVGQRDGLQNEKVLIPTEQKIQFIQMLAAAGLPVVEATSFVSPRAIPQLGDASAVMAGLTRLPATEYPVLVPNIKGRSEEHTSELQSLRHLVCRLLLEKKKKKKKNNIINIHII